MLSVRYKYTDYSIAFSLLVTVLIGCFFTWRHPSALNFMGGDGRYYYYYLQSTFIDAVNANYDWLNGPGVFTMTHHPVGLGLLWLPFFLVALGAAHLFHYPLTGLSGPFQLALAAAALVYLTIGLVALKKLLRLNGISDKVSALIIPLLLFGTNLIHYALTEAGMSHVYSFSLITAFLYHSGRFVQENRNRNLLYMSILLGFILLIRPNNGLVIFSLFLWFNGWQQCRAFFRALFRNRFFYTSTCVLLLIVFIQPLTWHFKENVLFADRYAPYGFYWSRPAMFKMLFGFNAGFFIYTPLCLLFLAGLVFVYKQSRFMFYAAAAFVLLLFYFFSAYSEYSYYDGLGIRVLVDYYGLFALLGAKLWSRWEAVPLITGALTLLALTLVYINLVYCYQGATNILARSGMNYNKWKYVFLKTGDEYRNCLGGTNDMEPYAKERPPVSLSAVSRDTPFDFSKKEFGLGLTFNRLGFNSNRICLKMDVARSEAFVNSSRDAFICAVLQDSAKKGKGYLQIKLNETPSVGCCPESAYHYVMSMSSDFKSSDCLSVYFWNRSGQPFRVNKFSVQVYNYNYDYGLAVKTLEF